MHPQVSEHKNTHCNQKSNALNNCLQQEFEVVRKQHLAIARERRARIEATWKKTEQEKLEAL
ncbi:hypothetical protein BB561_002513 [Smittium simulii]|uniref:COX assembly mitochondrial protein n=1 Tax=Smittium simulii TaxID=133385 RepID=A0A2T9YQ99_9FUNG|nr:hypothetical protein BB561_002513 [Smittium simulii]